jgi:putative exosortase-associated protein (TIGR04073 family)
VVTDRTPRAHLTNSEAKNLFDKITLQLCDLMGNLILETEISLNLANTFMCSKLSLVAVLGLTAVLAAGCANAERKFGRGMSNTLEVVRLGEIRRSIEQTALFEGPDAGYTAGFITGLNRTLARTGLGIYEMVTFPFPTPGHGYDPLFTDYLTPGPVYPDSYAPGLIEGSTFATDTNLGYSGGDVMPFVPGSRFRIFDTH